MTTYFKFYIKNIFFIFTIFFIAIQPYITSASAENASSEIKQKNNEAITSELSKIKQDRLSIEDKYKTQEATCYKKFAVNDCLKDIKTEKLAALNTLKRREIELNDTLRQSKMLADQEKRAKIAEKKLDSNDAMESNASAAKDKDKDKDKDKAINKERVEKAERLPSKEPVAKAERLPQSASDESKRKEAASKRAEKTQKKLAMSQRKIDAHKQKSKQANAESDKYNKKILDAEAHKNAKQQSNLAKTKPKSAPLPMPADLKPQN
jgi:colicin import membrane protein